MATCIRPEQSQHIGANATQCWVIEVNASSCELGWMRAAEVSTAKSMVSPIFSSNSSRQIQNKSTSMSRRRGFSSGTLCHTVHIWDDNCCFESRTKADTIPPPSWPLLSLETQQESRLIWVQKGRVTHRLLKNDVEVKSPNSMPPYKSPSPATPGGGFKVFKPRGVKFMHGAILNHCWPAKPLERIEMELVLELVVWTCQLANSLQWHDTWATWSYLPGKKTLVWLPSVTRGSCMRLQKKTTAASLVMENGHLH